VNRAPELDRLLPVDRIAWPDSPIGCPTRMRIESSTVTLRSSALLRTAVTIAWRETSADGRASRSASHALSYSLQSK